MLPSPTEAYLLAGDEKRLVSPSVTGAARSSALIQKFQIDWKMWKKFKSGICQHHKLHPNRDVLTLETNIV